MKYRIHLLAVEKGLLPLPGVCRRMKAAARRCLAGESVARAEVNICVCSDAMIERFNRAYLNHRGPTDVISFTASGPKSPVLEADVMVSRDTAAANAKIYHSTPERELCLYAVHGVLHAAGYDDKTPSQRKRMEEKAWRYLRLKPWY